MTLTRKRTAAPSHYAWSTTEAKAWLRLDCAEDDTIVGDILAASQEWVENQTGQALTQATWVSRWDEFPTDPQEPLELSPSPVQAVSSVQYVDAAGATQTWSTGDYRVDLNAKPARITPAIGEAWPVAGEVTGAVTVTYTVGYTTADGQQSNIPADLRTAVRMLAAHWYENRGEVVPGINNSEVTDIPAGVRALAAMHWTGQYV